MADGAYENFDRVKKDFLFDFASSFEELIPELKKEMAARGVNRLNLDSLEAPGRYNNQFQCYERSDGEPSLDFCNGNFSRASDIDKNLVFLYDFLDTYPSKGREHQRYHSGFAGGDRLDLAFSRGARMAQSIARFFSQKD